MTDNYEGDLAVLVGGRHHTIPVTDLVRKVEMDQDIATLETEEAEKRILRDMAMSGDLVFRCSPDEVDAEITDQNDNTAQVLTGTVAGSVAADGAGTLKVTVTARGMTNSPKTVDVAVANSDAAADIAGKIRTELTADVDISNTGSAFFTVSGTGVEVILTANAEAPNDTTMDIAIDVNNVGEGDAIGIANVIDPEGKAYTRYVQVYLETADGDPHLWYSGDIAVTIAETTAGDGAGHVLVSTLTMDAGHAQATVYLSGTWAADDTNTMSVSEATILGYTVSAATSVETSIDTP